MDSDIKWPQWMISSQGEGLSLRIKGYLVAVIPAVVFISQALGHPLVEADLSSIVNAIVLIVSSFGAIVGALMTIAGWARRNYNKDRQVGKFSPNFGRGN